MQALLYFLNRYGNFLLFILLQIIALILLLRFDPAKNSMFLKSSNLVSGFIFEKYDHVAQYFQLNKRVLELQEKNELAFEQSPVFLEETIIYKDSITDTIAHQKYNLIAARVINNTVSSSDNYITIDKGSKDGVSKGMGIISSEGPVGIVLDVSKNYARVVSLLNRNFNISASMAETNYFGTLNWEGGDVRFIKLKYVPKHADIKKNDKVISSSYSKVFPSGLTIGYINDFKIPAGSNFMDINVRLSVDLSRVKFVYVVNNLDKEEIEKVEEATIE